MRAIIILLGMIFLHCFADYFLQGILAEMKQKKWWKDQIIDLDYTKYKDDYKIALVVHSFEWSFVIMLPIFIKAYLIESLVSILLLLALFCANAYFHYKIDDAKANKHIISLRDDQEYHMLQIFMTWGLWGLIIGW